MPIAISEQFKNTSGRRALTGSQPGSTFAKAGSVKLGQPNPWGR
ncbi:hypothetical protein [Gemmiger qucibialis]|nr:hypothetical protein [Gemmiger qucibialis]